LGAGVVVGRGGAGPAHERGERMSYSAHVTEVKPYQPGERTDVVAVTARFDYAYGAAWWCETAPGPALDARYMVTIAAAPARVAVRGVQEPGA
jgi:hypothetical protein